MANTTANAPANTTASTTASTTDAPSETSTVTQGSNPSGQPIDIKWKMKKLDGGVDLLVNPDGSYDFSGGFRDKKPGKDWDISVALKSDGTGAIYVFHHEGDAANGIQFSDTGQSTILKDDFANTANYSWSGAYRFHLTDAARRAHYEEEKRKLEKLRKDEAEARKRHDEKLVAQKKAEEKQEAAAELAWEENYASQHPAGGGGGGGVGGVISGVGNAVASTVSSVVSTVGGVIGDIGSLF